MGSVEYFQLIARDRFLNQRHWQDRAAKSGRSRTKRLSGITRDNRWVCIFRQRGAGFDLPDNGQKLIRQLKGFLASLLFPERSVRRRGFLPGRIRLAARRYRSWAQLNPDATLEARAATLDQIEDALVVDWYFDD